MSGWTDGWEDDDDVDLEDDDEIFVQVDEEAEEKVDKLDDPSSQVSTAIVPGLFIGRLTRIISHVAAPPAEGVPASDENVETQVKQSSLADRLPPLLSTPKADISCVDDGWDDDLDGIDGDEGGGWGDEDLDEIDVDDLVPEEHETRSTTAELTPGNRKSQDSFGSLNQKDHVESAAPPHLAEEAASGWDDSLTLDEVDKEQATDGTPRMRVPPSPPPVSSLSLFQAQNSPRPEPLSPMKSYGVDLSCEVESSGNNGWDDPDLEVLDEIPDEEVNNEEKTEAKENNSDDTLDIILGRGSNDENVSAADDVPSANPEEAESDNVQKCRVREEQGGWEESALDALDEFERSRSPLSHPLTMTSALVDQVPPEETPPVALRDSTSAMASDQSVTLGEESYVEEQYYGPVVDHLPPPFRPSPVGTASILTQVRFEEMDQDDNEVGEDTAPGEASEEALNGTNPGPVVVDHVPVIAGVRTRVRSSTFAVASEQSGTVMEDIWREDFAPNDEDYGPVVDHLPTPETPTPSMKSIRSLSSLAVQKAITEEDDDEDEDTSEIPGRTGPFSGASVADSMAVIAPITEIDEDNTVGQAMDGVDGDTLHDDETVSNAPLTTDGNNSLMATTREEPLVDHVPIRRERKPTDASTLVLVDPSEVSTVGDMTYEDMQFGLVVDHTPPPRQLTWAVSGTASIVVAANKSECPDDLEDGMDDETYAMGTGEDVVSMESTIAEQTTPGDQLVDHVPEGHVIRRVNSASAIAEAQSVISTTDDEYGLVVDHTPFNTIGVSSLSRDSVGALATLSECETIHTEDLRSVPESVRRRRIEVEQVPLSSDLISRDSGLAAKSAGETADGDTVDEMSAINEFGQMVDHLPSIATPAPVSRGNSTAGAVAGEIADGDTIDEISAVNEYGLVVDHLPSVATPISASRGGSTNGAHATRSEADFDAHSEDVDGWEDDDAQDGVTVGTRPREGDSDDFKEETPETRNRSVTFQNIDYVPIFTRKSTLILPDHSSQYLSVCSPYDGEDDSNVGKSANGSISLEGSLDCRACAESGSLDCPCIQRILACKGDKSGAIVRRISPDGIPVDIDYSKLLQDEVTKRVLLEKEVEKYQSLLESVQSCKTEASSGDHSDLLRLQSSNEHLLEKLRDQEEESKSLRIQVSDWKKKMTSFQRERDDEVQSLALNIEVAVQNAVTRLTAEHETAISEYARINLDLASESKLVKEENTALHRQLIDVVEELKSLRDQVGNASDSEMKLRHEIVEIKRAHSEIESSTLSRLEQNDLLAKQKEERYSNELRIANETIHRLESQAIELSGKVDFVEKNLVTANEEVARLSQVEREFTKAEPKYQFEIEKLRKMISDTSNASDIANHLKSKIDLLEDELKSKDASFVCLQDKLMTTEKTLKESEAKCFAQMKDSARVSKNCNIEVEKLRRELEDTIKKSAVEVAARDATIADGHARLASALDDLAKVSDSKEELKRRVHQLLAVVDEKDLLESNLSRVTVENASLSSQLQQQQLLLLEVQGERDQLREAVATHGEKIQQLQEELDSDSSLVELQNAQNVLLEVRRANEQLMDNVTRYEEKIKNLEFEVANGREEIQRLRSQTDDLPSQTQLIANLKAMLEDCEQSLLQKDLSLDLLHSQTSSLTTQLDVSTRERDDLIVLQRDLRNEIIELREKEKSYDDVMSHCKRLESQLAKTVELHKAEVEHRLRHDEIEAQLRLDLDTLFKERDSILSEMRQHEEDSEDMLVQLGLNKEEMDALHDALRSSESSNVRVTNNLRAAEETIYQLEHQLCECQSQKNDLLQLSQNSELAEELERLIVQNADLQQELDDRGSANAFIRDKLQALEAENETLRGKCQFAEAKVSQVEHLEKACNRWENEYHELKVAFDRMEEFCALNKRDNDLLAKSLKEAEATTHYFEQLAKTESEKNQSLDKTLKQQQEAMVKQDKAFQQARQQIQELHLMSESHRDTAFAEMCQRIQKLELQLLDANEEARKGQIRVCELETSLALGSQELERTNLALSIAEHTVQSVELEMNSAVNESTRISDLEKLLEVTEEKLKICESDNHIFLSQRSQIEERLNAMVEDLAKSRDEVSLRNHEIEHLKSTIQDLHEAMETRIHLTRSQEDKVHVEISALRNMVEEYQAEIATLQKHVRSLSHELSTTKDVLSLKEEELQRVSLELEENRTAQVETTQRVTESVLRSEVSEAGQDPADNMRALVITLSQALEKSESQRADAIDRLLRERRTNADSLKRLGESVKRFYTTLNGTSP